MASDPPYPTQDPTLFHQHQYKLQACGWPDIAAFHETILGENDLESPLQANTAQLNHIFESSDKHKGIVEPSRSSATSDYSFEDHSTDSARGADQSSRSSSEDEESTYQDKITNYVNLPRRGFEYGKSSEQYECIQSNSRTGPWNHGEPFAERNTATQQVQDPCIDPILLDTQQAGSKCVKQKLSLPANPHKRKRVPEHFVINAQRRSIDRVPLLTPEILQQLRAIPNTGLSKVCGVYAEVPSDSGFQSSRAIQCLTHLIVNYVQDLLRISVDRALNVWSPPVPTRCLQKYSGQPVSYEPRNPHRPFTCVSGCGLTFKQLIDWKRHMAANWLQGDWRCPLCDEFHCKRPDKLYGVTGHLGKRHSRPEEKANEERDYRPHPSELIFRKQCGFCGLLCESFNIFIAHVGVHFREGCGMDSWRDPWYEIEQASAENNDDDDDDDEDSNSNDDKDGKDKYDDGSQPDGDRSGREGSSHGGGGTDDSTYPDPNPDDDISKKMVPGTTTSAGSLLWAPILWT